jgi:hypothetical protein
VKHQMQLLIRASFLSMISQVAPCQDLRHEQSAHRLKMQIGITPSKERPKQEAARGVDGRALMPRQGYGIGLAGSEP